MKRLSIVWTFSLLAPMLASAEEAKKDEGVFDRRPDIKKIIAVDPKDVIDARQAVKEMSEATYRPLAPLPKAKSDVSELFLTANEEVPVIHIAPGNPTSIEFTDITGAPWPILEHRSFSSFVTTTLAGVSARNSVWVVGQEVLGEAVLSFYLKELETVVSVKVVADGENYHRNKTLKIMRLGENAKINRLTVREAEEAGQKTDEDLVSAAYGIRPNGFTELNASSDSVVAWQKENELIIYSNLDLMLPNPTAIKTGSANGWRSYRVPMTSRLTFTNETGKVVYVQVEPKRAVFELKGAR